MLPDPRKSKKAFILLSYQLENQESDITGTRKVAFLHILFRVQKKHIWRRNGRTEDAAMLKVKFKAEQNSNYFFWN